ncbi:hypothetical protein GCM10009837_84770 [Streptomyces durmitorensis]|uniref:Integral membrane protein n=1 Tax=Streptomyces durmitorensis TaxID=319947 RepID=A0ABY4PNN6_9ACTN|nr:hypothetical protein [Streptomyces durmitorensis]UQT54745.1 hypothetical protein M4V62_06365 [Streptomyces durmitorensis]
MSGPLPLRPRGGNPRGTENGDAFGADDTLALRLARPPRAASDDGRPRIRTGVALRPARADDPVDRLAAELADDAGAAVHPYEVAALLESQGLTGDRIQETYGHPDLFSLADAVFRRVPRSHPKPPVPPDPWRPDHLRCALRGLLFALPGTAYVLAQGAWGSSASGLYGLIAAALVSWAWSQALSHRAYSRLAAGRHEAGRTLLRGAPLGVVAASVTGLLVAGPGAAALFAVGQSCYLAAAGLLLVLGREKILAAALLPVVLAAAAEPWWQPPQLLRTGLPLLTVLLATAAAAHALRSALRATPAPGPVPPLVGSLPYGLFGLAAGTLTAVAGQQEPYAVIVLTLSMGPAEWLLYRYRGLAVAALHASTTPRGFRLRAARALAVCGAAYLLPLALGAVLVGASAARLLLLGAVLWIALLLQAFGAAWPSAAPCLAAAATATALPLTGTVSVPTAQLIGCTAAVLALLAVAVHRLGRPTAHA